MNRTMFSVFKTSFFKHRASAFHTASVHPPPAQICLFSIRKKPPFFRSNRGLRLFLLPQPRRTFIMPPRKAATESDTPAAEPRRSGRISALPSSSVEKEPVKTPKKAANSKKRAVAEEDEEGEDDGEGSKAAAKTTKKVSLGPSVGFGRI